MDDPRDGVAKGHSEPEAALAKKKEARRFIKQSPFLTVCGECLTVCFPTRGAGQGPGPLLEPLPSSPSSSWMQSVSSRRRGIAAARLALRGGKVPLLPRSLPHSKRGVKCPGPAPPRGARGCWPGSSRAWIGATWRTRRLVALRRGPQKVAQLPLAGGPATPASPDLLAFALDYRQVVHSRHRRHRGAHRLCRSYEDIMP